MHRKRELVAEKWVDLMEMNRQKAKEVGIIEFHRIHREMGHDMVDVLYEFQMSAAWKDHGMQVYEFDPSFADSIVGEKWADLLPMCIGNRPHDCFYMKLPFNELSEGVVVYVNPVENVETFEAKWFTGCEDGPGVYIGGVPGKGERAVVNTGSGMYCLNIYSIPKELGLMLDDTELGSYPAALVANGVAYLCSANADIVATYKPKPERKRNNAKRRSHATWHEVGYRIGAELRAYERVRRERIAHQGGTVRPHMRRAHWHHYWTGPRDGERKLVLRWVAPTMVGVGKIESATGHMVT